MAGLKRMDNIEELWNRVLAEQVPGDFVETGAWPHSMLHCGACPCLLAPESALFGCFTQIIACISWHSSALLSPSQIAGVWRGGSSIFSRAVLAAHGITDRKVQTGLPSQYIHFMLVSKSNHMQLHMPTHRCAV